MITSFNREDPKKQRYKIKKGFARKKKKVICEIRAMF